MALYSREVSTINPNYQSTESPKLSHKKGTMLTLLKKIQIDKKLINSQLLKHAKFFVGTTFGLQNFKKFHSKMYYNYISTIHPYMFKKLIITMQSKVKCGTWRCSYPRSSLPATFRVKLSLSGFQPIYQNDVKYSHARTPKPKLNIALNV